MKLIPLRSSLSLLALAAFAGSATAQDAVVPDDFATIQSAVLGATDVDLDGTVEILVRAGTYNENVFIQRSDLEISGEGPASTSVVGGGILDTFRVQVADRVTLRDMAISNVGSGAAIELQRTSFATVTGNDLGPAQDGLEVNRSDNAMISGNEAFGNLQSGIQLARTSSCVVMNNDCHDNGHQGIDLAAADSNIVEGNTATANGGSGIRLRASSGNQVTANVSTANVDDGFRMRRASSNNVLSMNTASGNLSNGLRMRGTSTNLITMNAFTNNLEYGVRRRDWVADDFDAATAGVQDPAGDNDLSGNVQGPLRED